METTNLPAIPRPPLIYGGSRSNASEVTLVTPNDLRSPHLKAGPSTSNDLRPIEPTGFVQSTYEHDTSAWSGTRRRLRLSDHERRFSRSVSWDHFTGKDRRHIGWLPSLKAFALSSWLNLLILLTPVAWAVQLTQADIPGVGRFLLLFFSIIPFVRIYEWGSEQLACYCGKNLGDLIVVTMNNLVEVTLAIFLLVHCELRILQSTIVGVILLHLLLIPGISFLVGGALVTEQTLDPHFTQLNHSLLTVGLLSLLVPTAMFAALDRLAVPAINGTPSALINDTVRGHFLIISQGIAIILLVIYIGSRFFLHSPPESAWEDRVEKQEHGAPAHTAARHHTSKAPKTNIWVCIIVLATSTGIMATSVHWLVESIEVVRENGMIQEEWFGLILLPVISFSADALVATVYFIRSSLCRILRSTTARPEMFAQARAIDLSIQFTLAWMPFLVIVGWCTGRPLILLFDFFEVAMLLGACFLINCVTSDGKTNWAEGLCLVGFYMMIALCAWFYPGQPEIQPMTSCKSVAEALLGTGKEGG